MNKTIIECKNLTLTLNNHQILKNLNFVLEENNDLVIFGPNGAGKTMLLTVLSGNLEPTSGEVYVYGELLNGSKAVEIKKQIGFVSPRLFDDYDFNSKVSDVVMSGLFGSIGIASDPTKQNNKVVKEFINRVIAQRYGNTDISSKFLEQVEALDLKDEIFGRLSYGQKVRILIARALINEPKLLILDEPTTGLDIELRAKFINLVRELSQRVDIIYVTHYLEEILPEFNKALLLKKGVIFAFDEKEKLFTSEKMSQLLDINVSVHERDGKYLMWF